MCCCNPRTAAASGLPFPYYFQSEENDADQVVNSTTPVTVLTLTTPVIAAGTYGVNWYGETFQSVTGLSASVQVLVDGVVVSLTRHGDEVDILDVLERGGFAIRALTAASHTILMQAFASSPANVTIRRRRLYLVRVA